MAGIKRGAEMICNSKEFEALRVNDRLLSNGTSSGWRDGMINGKFKGKATHVVEIQLHHDKLVSIREDLGGHYMYSMFRSLVEALEVVFGDENGKVQRMIAEHALKPVGTADILTQLRADNAKLESDIETLRSSNNDMAAKMGQLEAEIETWRSSSHEQTLQVGKGEADNNHKLAGEIEKLISNKKNETSSVKPEKGAAGTQKWADKFGIPKELLKNIDVQSMQKAIQSVTRPPNLPLLLPTPTSATLVFFHGGASPLLLVSSTNLSSSF
jgi:hypothetical protein